ncbi:hypothetical protein [Nonomuraea gerenzanensis]|uniref:Uncharacterized protein n=1 Tax=Nonomuraea gerenzanensis TaxID=93944 RepID=A0A1M4EPI6_9ACTN|nr:hypothetical protein [Nonomuraea gerenzanensis]UBU12210.1 hypothetical protein LCN96_49305 [Nonomuraea gerenzanensis]SBP00734.1 hypothetical protein BN4615_P10250 [Nonomuraea gerenzanensis]
MLPLAGLGIVVTPLAVTLARRAGMRVVLVSGSALLLAGSCTMLAARTAWPVLAAAVLLPVRRPAGASGEDPSGP